MEDGEVMFISASGGIGVNNNYLEAVCPLGIAPSYDQTSPSITNLPIGVITTLIGVAVTIFGITCYIITIRNRAKFGFYINMLVYLTRLEEITKLPHAYSCLWKKDIYECVYPEFSSGEVIEIHNVKLFALVNGFHTLLRSASENIPPKGRGPKDIRWSMWYADVFRLSDFFVKVDAVDKGGYFEFYKIEHKKCYEDYMQIIKETILRMTCQLETKLGFTHDGLTSLEKTCHENVNVRLMRRKWRMTRMDSSKFRRYKNQCRCGFC